MRFLISIGLLLILMPVKSGINIKPQVDYCRVFGAIYFEKNKELADYSVYVTTTEGFADVVVFEEENHMMADDSGLWYITQERGFADHILYLEKEQGLADFSIFYTDVQAFATCN